MPPPNRSDRADSQPPGYGRTLLDALLDALRQRAFKVGLILALAGLGVIVASFYLPDPNDSPITFALREVGAGLLVAGVITTFLYLTLQRHEKDFRSRLDDFIEQDITNRLAQIEEQGKKQAEQIESRLFAASASLEALNERDVARVYATRGGVAREDLRNDLEAPAVGHIRLMGVSLNDFVRSDQVEGLHGVWDVITRYVCGEKELPAETESLSIQVLIADPNCLGARLRSFVETEQTTGSLAGRLEADVTQTASHLTDLCEAAQAAKERPISFDFHMYHLPPTLFVCDTEHACYAQPYYFWSQRDPTTVMPLLRLRADSPLQHGIQHHFDAIWEHGSIDGREWVTEGHVGWDKGIHETGVVNVFSNPRQAHDRMLCVLEQAQHKVYLQGIALHSFFKAGPLLNGLQKVLKRGIDVRVLLLDPNCDQAYQRSFREYALAQPGGRARMRYARYSQDRDLHKAKDLSRDSEDTIARIKELAAEAPKAEAPKFQARLYDCGPACFMLLVDDHLFVEQYHFGKKVDSAEQQRGVITILGSDMPLVEYKRGTSKMFKGDPVRMPYELLENHFEFVFTHFAHPIRSRRSGR